ncbi:unnamed protein product, partial [marine sediment metagenome]
AEGGGSELVFGEGSSQVPGPQLRVPTMFLKKNVPIRLQSESVF